jgi:superfamily II DNA or RNA helicase
MDNIEISSRKAWIKSRLQELQDEKESLISELDALEQTSTSPSIVQRHSDYSSSQKIAIFRRLFRGRTDVFPRRFESRKSGKSGYSPVCANEWKPGVCLKPKVKCADCQHRDYVPLTDSIIEQHLRGKDAKGNNFVIGVYPLLADEHCRFLAVDFDKKEFQNDASAFLDTCRRLNIPAALERSRSGNGAHIWIFFSEPIPARDARQIGCHILTETMEQRPELGFESYDRFFPNQDTMPAGGFGNLIALPLQAEPRQNGNSVFLNEDFIPWLDQWAFLDKMPTMSAREVSAIANKARETGRIVGVKMPEYEDATPPWKQPPSRKIKSKKLNNGLKEPLEIVIENQFYFKKSQLTPRLRTALLRLAAFQNPEFYRTQAMRMPVYNKPRIISCAEDFPEYIGLPRGCADELAELLISHKIRYTVADKRNIGESHQFTFIGKLRSEQQKALDCLIKFDLGVLSASTAFGKTVVAISLLARRSVNTLILVHRLQLVEQWKARLQTFLGIPESQIGIIGGGKHKPSGVIDIASIQSLNKKGVVDDLVGNYGMVIADECHHLSAFSFETVIRQCKCRYVLGLSATLTRKDGHHPIIFMQCGPIRYAVSDRRQAAERPFTHRVKIRQTNVILPEVLSNQERILIHQLYDLLIYHEGRNAMIISEVLDALRRGRSPVVLTERKEHLAYLEEQFRPKVKNLLVFRGGMRKKALRELMEKLAEIPESEDRLLLATGRFLGEGFDDSRLDTLFLTMPISWKGTLAQYAGRLHRLHDSKKEVVIYDYVDMQIPMLARMFSRRCKGYEAIGYYIDQGDELFTYGVTC